MQNHAQSAPHLHSAYNVRYLLDPSTKSQNEKDLLKTLDLESVTLEQAVEGLALLEEWKSEEGVKEEYRRKAGRRWEGASRLRK